MSRGTKNGLLLLMLVVGLAAILRYWGWPRSPLEVQVHFVGRVRLYQPPELSSPLPTYYLSSPLEFLFSPEKPDWRECDPFAGGRLALKVESPDHRTLLEQDVSLEDQGIRSVPGGYLFELQKKIEVDGSESSDREGSVPGSEGSAPDSSADVASIAPAGGAVHSKAYLTQTGLYSLELRWQCLGEGSSVRSEDYPFYALRPRQSTAFWREKVSKISELDMGGRVSAYRRLLGAAPDALTRAWLREELFRALMAEGDYFLAEQGALDWARMAREAGLVSDVARAFNGAHEATREMGRLRASSEYLDKSEEILRKLDFVVRDPDTWYARCILADRSGKALTALQDCARAELSAYGMGRDRLRVAAKLLDLVLLQRLGHYRLVNKVLREELLSGHYDNPVFLNNIGWLVVHGLEAGLPVNMDPDFALSETQRLFEKARRLYEKAGRAVDVGIQQYLLADLAIRRGRFEKAHALMAEARARVNTEDPEVALALAWNDARIHMADGDLSGALDGYTSLEEAAGRTAFPIYMGRAAYGQGQVFSRMGRIQDARAAFDRSLAVIDDRANVVSPVHRGALMASQINWLAGAVQSRLALGEAWDALEIVESRNWISRHTQIPSEEREYSEDDEARLEQIQRAEAELETRLRRQPVLAGGSSPEDASTFDLTEQLKAQLQTLWAERLRIELGDETETPPSLQPDGIRSRIPENGLLLRYLILPEELILWRIDGDSFRVERKVIKRWELERLIRAFANSCRTGIPDRSSGKKLTELLLGPEIEASPPGNLLIVAEDALRELPWAALPVGERYLVESSVIRFLPMLLPLHAASASATETREAGAARSASRLLVIADPTRDLRAAFQEGRRLEAAYPRAKVLFREKATAEVVLTGMKVADFVHYAGHGLVETQNPYLSHLRLARGEQLNLLNILHLELKTELVFLNACAVGRPALDSGGTLGVADGFLAAGAHTVVASNWDVPDKAGQEISLNFYKSLFDRSKGTSAAAALAESQRAMIRRSSSNPSPSNVWAAYFVLSSLESLP